MQSACRVGITVYIQQRHKPVSEIRAAAEDLICELHSFIFTLRCLLVLAQFAFGGGGQPTFEKYTSGYRFWLYFLQKQGFPPLSLALCSSFQRNFFPSFQLLAAFIIPPLRVMLLPCPLSCLSCPCSHM